MSWADNMWDDALAKATQIHEMQNVDLEYLLRKTYTDKKRVDALLAVLLKEKQDEIALREKYPGLQDLYNQYQEMLILVSTNNIEGEK